MAYICDCGKVFESKHSLTGHKVHCESYYMKKYGNLDYLYELNRIRGKKAEDRKPHQVTENELINNQKWIDEGHFCEKCGALITKKIGSGRFCSRSCANSRVWSDEINNKRRKTLHQNPIYIAQQERKKQRIIDKELKKHNVSTHKHRNLSESFLATTYKDYIVAHNKTILEQYENLLATKAVGKLETFNFCILFAQYYAVYNANHPRQNQNYVFVHILLAERLLGRYLNKSEIVHHKNEDKLDNRFDNIYIFKSKADHARFHYAKLYWLSIDNDTLVCDKIDYDKLYQHHLHITNNIN